jgi:CcmD family protein
MSEWNYVIAAYALTWVVLVGYAILVNGRLLRAERALRAAEVEE